jgi:hypothetical protein
MGGVYLMGEYINFVTLIRNLIISIIFGLLVPYLLITFVDPSEFLWNEQLMYINGIIFVGIYTTFGIFKKETVIRFLIGLGYIGVIVYFYTVGGTYISLYLPSCGFGHACYAGNFFGYEITLGYYFIYTVILILVLKFLNLLRHLVKPPDLESKYKTAVLKKMKLRKE